MPAGHGGEQVDAERLVGGGADGRHLLHHLLVAHGRRAEAPEATGLGDRGRQRGIRDAAHPGQHDGVLDAEQLGETSAHVKGLPCFRMVCVLSVCAADSVHTVGVGDRKRVSV